MKRAHKALLRGLLGLALLAAVLALADPARVLAQLRQAHIGWLLAGLAAGIASNLVSALRRRALARRLEQSWQEVKRRPMYHQQLTQVWKQVLETIRQTLKAGLDL